MIQLDLKTAVSLAEEIVSKKPDYVYERPRVPFLAPGCLYVHEGPEGTKTPGCLVGRILNRIGVPLELLQAADQREGGSSISDLYEWDFFNGVVSFGDAFRFLDELQNRQDNGATWGDSLASAKRTI